MSDESLDVARLDEWIGDRLPGLGAELTAERMGEATGIANTLFLLGRGKDRWVLRRPPKVKNDPSAANTQREWRILKALDGTPVAHPRARLYCDDPEVLGSAFMIMDLVDGFTPGFEIPSPFRDEAALKYDLGMAYVDGCAELSKVDWRARDLEGLGKPAGFLERQVPRWMAQLERYRTRSLPELDFLTDWLERNRPATYSVGLLHGDYSPFNVMVRPNPPVELAAIIDWDTGTIGDPLLDIGHLLARWTEPGEETIIGEQAGGLDGYPTRAEMAERYHQRTSADLTSLPYYEALSLFKLAVILEGTFTRQRTAGVPDEHNSVVDLVPRLLVGAARFARGELA
jgi:aminoglycoside phosphotransferase (APT) family kinase protein